jgi:hypothetical protein
MKSIGIFMLVLLFAGCTVADRTLTSVHFTELGTEVTITQWGIKSNETAPDKIKSDFEELIREYERAGSDDSSTVLLDKSLEIKDGVIVASYRMFKSNDAGASMDLIRRNGEIIHVLVESPRTCELISSNARVIRTDSNLILFWPDSARDLNWLVQDSAAVALPNNMITLFQAWKNGPDAMSEPRPEANR